MTKIISVELELMSGKNLINLIEGTIVNDEQHVNENFSDYDAKAGKEIYMEKVRSFTIFADADLKMQFSGAEVEFDMMSFYKTIRPIEIEDIALIIDNEFVPNSTKVIIVASDDPNFDFGVSAARPHLFYSNDLETSDDEQTLFFRHTITDRLVCSIFNDDAAAKDIVIDIQHREMPEGDTNDDWISYQNYPKDLVAGDIEEFGDDGLRATKHHFHRVTVKSKTPGEVSPVRGSLYAV